jgi:hypothetical protein
MIPDNEIIIEDELITPEDEAILRRIIFELLPKELNEL